MHSLPLSISVCLAKSKIFSRNFSFLSDNFSLWTKTEAKQHQTLSVNGGYIGRKIYVAERTYFLCLTATVHRKSYLKEAKSYLINVREKPFNAVWKIYLAELDNSQMAPIRFAGSSIDFQRKDMVSKKCKIIRQSTEASRFCPPT